jgi:hypothetical protein
LDVVWIILINKEQVAGFNVPMYQALSVSNSKSAGSLSQDLKRHRKRRQTLLEEVG